jgi:hypothetical protein
MLRGDSEKREGLEDVFIMSDELSRQKVYNE